jgi:hypothetical protein
LEAELSLYKVGAKNKNGEEIEEVDSIMIHSNKNASRINIKSGP